MSGTTGSATTGTAAHPVAPDEVMAMLDGELSASEAQAVAAHLDECAECAGVAAQFRSLSEQLAGWSVPAVPARVETAVMEQAAAGSGGAVRRRWSPIRGGGSRWKWWMGGAAAAVGVLLVVASPRAREPRAMHEAIMQPQSEYAASIQQPRAGLAMPAPDTPPGSMNAGIAGMAGAPAAAVAALTEQRMRPEMQAASPQLQAQQGKGSFGQLVARAPAAPMIARTVSLTLRVKDVEEARPALEAVLARHHGYMAQMNASTAEGSPRGFTASLRVPAAELAAALKEFRTLGRVENESQSGEEVTQQHEDLVARLKTARETEARFQAILQQRTGRVSDVLEVEQEIARVRGEIESMEAEQAGLERRVDFASVDLSLVEVYKAQFSAPDSVGTRVRNAFVTGYGNAWETVLGIVLFLEEYGPSLAVWGILLGLPGMWVWRRYRRVSGR